MQSYIRLFKWRAIKISKLLNMQYSDELDLIMKLSDFWLSIGTPSDMPFELQCVKNDISPEKYFSLDNIRNVIKAQKNWLITELALLR
ncbi:MAG: DUF2247 family protein [Oscillospiraceae bacterium]